MADYDRSKLARIVAFGLHLGQSPDEIERRILSYAQSATMDEIDQAFLEGGLARGIALEMSRPAYGSAAGRMVQEEGLGAVGWQAVAHFQIVDGGEFRSVPFLAPAGTTPKQLATQAEDLAQQYVREGASQGFGLAPGTESPYVVPGSLGFTYVVPLF